MSDTQAMHRLKEAEYLVQEAPYGRLILRFFYRQHRSHQHYVRSDEVVRAVRDVFPDFEEATCRYHLQQLERMNLIREVHAQSKPANFRELKNLPKVYQAERIALRLEALRLEVEEEAGQAAVLNPGTLEHLVQRLAELVEWVAKYVGRGVRGDQEELHQRWDATHKAFLTFAGAIEGYLSDLPRHRPKETLDVEGFKRYSELVSHYLSHYIERLYQRREFIRHQIQLLIPFADAIANDVATVAARQIRTDGSRPDEVREREACLRGLYGMRTYFAEGGDATVLMYQAEKWIEEITSHARRLSEQHLSNSSVREQILLDLASRFITLPLEEAQWLAQVAFGATLPLHWKGEAEPDSGLSAWSQPAIDVKLQPVRRGPRAKTEIDRTRDRSLEALEKMRAEAVEREAQARDLAKLFGPSGQIELSDLQLTSPLDRRSILHLIYRALSRDGHVRVGYRDWYVTMTTPEGATLGSMVAPDGRLILPAFSLKLHRGRG